MRHTHKVNCPCKNFSVTLSSLTAAEFGILSNSHISSSSPARSSSGYTALHLAAQNNNVESTKLLLEKGNICVDGVLKINGGCGATPLHRASFSGACACMKLLIENGANLFAQDESFGDRMTPLHKAISGGRYKAVQLLLDELESSRELKRALQILDSQGRTALQVCRDILSESDLQEERQSVARWNKTAGGEPDWKTCLSFLEEAYSKVGLDMQPPRKHKISAKNSTPRAEITHSLSNFITNNEPSTNLGDINSFDPSNVKIELPNQLSSQSLSGQKCALCDKACLVLCRSRDKKSLVCRVCFRAKKQNLFDRGRAR